MKRSVIIKLQQILDKVVNINCLEQLMPNPILRDSQTSYWKRGVDEAILQEFDTLEVFLSCLDTLFCEERTIPIKVKLYDIHVLYTLEASAAIRLYDAQGHLISQQSCGRGMYYYLPPGHYSLTIPAGKSQLFGYYFQSKTFRKKNKKPYVFLHDLLRSRRAQVEEVVVSKDFKVGKRTRMYIRALCRGLKKRKLKNESFVFGIIHDLIDLSAEKISEEETKMSYDLKIAIQARKLLAMHIEEKGQETQINLLADDLKLDLDTVNRYHKQHFGKCLRELRTDLLLTRAKRLLDSGMGATKTAYELNYNSRDAFGRFLKKHSNQTPSEYLQSLDSAP
ncbi:helix-turn-helix domain-containing protein [Sphingobacterium faecale]|uniref:AraC family transcriptional regulator n=1 Tax=Sphingobacterium faecale TaxID=2803775 RepID=A0ABS1QYY1_9SPHI|nr:helix-turn-helix domain-containing protein [Sphingobacterium faecale]MBL1407519.1 AraC family transcriptional regulator [Sphingobacterium faecale]